MQIHEPTAWPYFAAVELKCKCEEKIGKKFPSCRMHGMDEDFMAKLVAIRIAFNRPLIISSAYRCQDYNRFRSSTGMTGPHTTGRAADILIHGRDAYRLLDIAMKHGIAGVGVHQHGPHESRFIHLDTLSRGEGGYVWSYV